MKITRPVVKRSCDDDYDDDWPPYFETGTSFTISETDRPKPRSMSRAAHTAIHYRPLSRIGFHKP